MVKDLKFLSFDNFYQVRWIDEYSKNQNVYQYAKNIFLEDYNCNYVTSKYEYNNIVWRLLVEYYKNVPGIKLSDFLITIDGFSKLGFSLLCLSFKLGLIISTISAS